MKNLLYVLVVLMSLGLIGFIGGCPQNLDDDSADDDDDSAADDDDDDDDTPDYEGTIDMDNAYLEASCTVTDESTPESPEGEGYFDFFIDVPGWADTEAGCWIEMWDLTSDYCEGYDPETGDPCDLGGTRPGWDMDAVAFGWDPTDGFWDQWELTLDYHGGGSVWPPDDDATLFICENAGNNFETYFCCCDLVVDTCDCTEFTAWD